MSEHVEEAKEWLRDAPVEQHGGNVERAMLCVGMAQAEATLAVAEQLRIANLFRLREEVNSGTWALFYDANSGVEGKGVHLALRPEIARALGLEVGDE